MKKPLSAMPLTPDDLECLWAIARRGSMQEQLMHCRGGTLARRGLIAVADGWPTLTAGGRRLLNDHSARILLELDRDQSPPV
jgi:hypothetical protein